MATFSFNANSNKKLSVFFTICFLSTIIISCNNQEISVDKYKNIKHTNVPEGFIEDSITYEEFEYSFKNLVKYRSIISGNSLKHYDIARLYGQFWNEIVVEKLLTPDLDYLGLNITDFEKSDMLYGKHPLRGIRELPFLLKDGAVQPNLVKQFIDKIEQDTQAAPKFMWKMMLNENYRAQKVEKYKKLLSSLYFQSVPEKIFYDKYNTTEIDFDYLFVPFAKQQIKVPDDTAVYQYYLKNIDKYFSTESRIINYVTVLPDTDSAHHLDELKRFSAIKDNKTTDFEALAAKNDKIKYTKVDYNIKDEKSHLKNFLETGQNNDTYGPYFANSTFRIVKIANKYDVFDSLKYRKIQLNDNDTVLLPQIMKSLDEQADFAELAEQYSTATSYNDGEIKWLKYEDASKEFAKIFSTSGNMYLVLSTKNSKHIFDIIERSVSSSKYATVEMLLMQLLPNEQDMKKLEKNIDKFVRQAKKEKNLLAKAVDYGYATQRLKLEYAYYGITEIENSLEMLQWSFKNSEGDISEPFKYGDRYYILNVEQIIPTGTIPFKEIKSPLADELAFLTISDSLYNNLLNDYSPGKSIEENAKIFKTEVLRIKKLQLSMFEIPTLGFESKVKGALIGLKTGETSNLIKGRNGIFMVRKTSERQIKADNTVKYLYNQYITDLDNGSHITPFRKNAVLYPNIQRASTSYLILKKYENQLPNSSEIESKMIDAEYLFRDKKWEEALFGTNNSLGFKQLLEITSQVHTKQYRLTKIYAAICYMQLEQHKAAIELLKTIEPMEDYVISGAIPMLIGDAYSFSDINKALEYYDIAAEKSKSSFYDGAILHKQMLAYYITGNLEKAYEAAQKLFKRSPESSNILVAEELMKCIEILRKL